MRSAVRRRIVAPGLLQKKGAYKFDILNYNPDHLWSSENVTTADSDTTVQEVDDTGKAATSYPLAAPSAAKRLTYNSSDGRINNLPTRESDGASQYLYNAIANWRGGDSVGTFVICGVDVQGVSGQVSHFSSNDEAAGSRIFGQDKSSNRYRVDLGTNLIRCNTSSVTTGSAYLWIFGSDGASYFARINNVVQTLVVDSGSNNGNWLGGLAGRDNITEGASVYSVNLYGMLCIYEKSYFSRVLTNDEMDEIWQGYKKKMGL